MLALLCGGSTFIRQNIQKYLRNFHFLNATTAAKIFLVGGESENDSRNRECELAIGIIYVSQNVRKQTAQNRKLEDKTEIFLRNGYS